MTMAMMKTLIAMKTMMIMGLQIMGRRGLRLLPLGLQGLLRFRPQGLRPPSIHRRMR
jgi:hypothetical protein